MTDGVNLRAVFSDPGIVPLPQHRVDFSDAHSGKHLKPKSANGSADTSPGGGGPPEEDWTICTRDGIRS